MAKFDETTNINIEDIIISKNEPKDEIKEEKPAEKIKIKKVSQSKEDKIEEASEKSKEITEKKDMAALENIVNNDFQEKTIVQMPSVNTKKIGIAADHRGYKIKQKLTKYLNKKGYTVVDYGGDGLKNDAYTDFGFKLGEAIKNHEIEKGIAICGSGIGISIACNKVQNVRCAKVNNVKEVKWATHDNDANVIAFSAKMPTFRVKDIIDVFLTSKFSNIQRHKERIEALNSYKG